NGPPLVLGKEDLVLEPPMVVLGSCARDDGARSETTRIAETSRTSARVNRSGPTRSLQVSARPHIPCGFGARRTTQPSSWCSNTVNETSKARPIGTHTA